MERILVIPWAYGIGDLIRHDPVLRAIKEKHPDSRIGVYTLKNYGVLKYHPCVNDQFTIWCSRCDYIYNFNTTGCGWLDTIKDDAGKYKELVGYHTLNTGTNPEEIKRFDEYRAWEKGFDWVLNLRRKNSTNLSEWLCRICNLVPSDPKIRFYLMPQAEILAKEYIKSIDKPVVLMHLFSEGKLGGGKVITDRGEIDLGKPDIKNWSIEKFRELIPKIKARGFEVLLIGAEKESAQIEELATATGARACLFPFFQNMALIKYADYFIGVDSGPSHVAMSFDVPALVIICELFLHAVQPVNSKVSHEFIYGNNPVSVEEVSVEMVETGFERLIEKNGRSR